MPNLIFDAADLAVVEDFNLIGLSRGMLAKHMLDAGHGQFINSIRPWVAFKRGKSVVKVDARKTSQICPDCGQVKKKKLSERIHQCDCGCVIQRDIASAIVIRNRYLGCGAHSE